MIVGHGSTSATGNCIFCNKRTSTYISFYEGPIEIKVYVCNAEYNKCRDLKNVMKNTIRLIKSNFKSIQSEVN